MDDPFFVDAPKLPELMPPTEAELDSWEFFFALIEKQNGLTREQFVALPKQAQATIQDATESVEARLWLDSPDSKGYVRTQENFKALGDWLNARNAPITVRNLIMAFKTFEKTREQIKQEHLEQLEREHKWQN